MTIAHVAPLYESVPPLVWGHRMGWGVSRRRTRPPAASHDHLCQRGFRHPSASGGGLSARAAPLRLWRRCHFQHTVDLPRRRAYLPWALRIRLPHPIHHKTIGIVSSGQRHVTDPDATGILPQGVFVAIPGVEISDHTDVLGLRSIESEKMVRHGALGDSGLLGVVSAISCLLLSSQLLAGTVCAAFQA